MIVNIYEKIGDVDFSADKETVWLKFRTDEEKFVVFWGELNAPNRNINALRNQQTPFQVQLLDPEHCVPTQREKQKHGLSLSIPSDQEIIIKPEP